MQLETEQRQEAEQRASKQWRDFRNAEHITNSPHSLRQTITHHVSHSQHGRRDSLHVFPPPHGPAAPSDRPPVHALLHQHIMSCRARGYVKNKATSKTQHIHRTNQRHQTATSSPRAQPQTHTLHATPNRCPDPRSPKPPTAQTSPKSSATTLPAAHHTTSPPSRNSSQIPSRH
jgi:hypothetical protein